VYAFDSISSCAKSCAIKCYVATAGDAKPAAQGQILRSTTKSFVATPAMIQSKTSLRFAPLATPPYIAAEELEPRHLIT
jgi:hypothetical protein